MGFVQLFVLFLFVFFNREGGVWETLAFSTVYWEYLCADSVFPLTSNASINHCRKVYHMIVFKDVRRSIEFHLCEKFFLAWATQNKPTMLLRVAKIYYIFGTNN